MRLDPTITATVIVESNHVCMCLNISAETKQMLAYHEHISAGK